MDDNESYKDNLNFTSETEDDVEVDYLNTIADTVTWSTDWTVESIITAQKRQTFNMNPSFQRRDAWNLTKKSRFIESLIFGLPVPQIVLAEDKLQRGKYLVVDGKQRLLTLLGFFSEQRTESFSLVGLKASKINGLRVKDLEVEHPDLYNNLLNQSIRSIVIKNWSTENLLYTIFFRLNSGSLPLSPQELRKALKPGGFLEKIDFYCSGSPAIKFLFGGTLPDSRMRDMDLILRFIVMTQFIEDYKGNYKAAVDQLCDTFNKNWPSAESKVNDILSSFEDTILTARTVFGDDEVFRRKSNSKVERRINRALFDVVCFYFSRLDSKVLNEKAEDIKNLTTELYTSNAAFTKAISSNTNNLKETSTRFVIYGNSLAEVLKTRVDIPETLINHLTKF